MTLVLIASDNRYRPPAPMPSRCRQTSRGHTAWTRRQSASWRPDDRAILPVFGLLAVPLAGLYVAAALAQEVGSRATQPYRFHRSQTSSSDCSAGRAADWQDGPSKRIT